MRPATRAGGVRERRGGRRERRDRDEPSTRTEVAEAGGTGDSSAPDPLQASYDVLGDALEALRAAGRDPVRDSDVKRKILDLRPQFDEAELGFAKFSKFLAQAAEHGIVRLDRTVTGNLDVSLPSAEPAVEPTVSEEHAGDTPAAERVEEGGDIGGGGEAVAAPIVEPEPEVESPPVSEEPFVVDVLPPQGGDPSLRLGPRLGSTRRRGDDTPPPFFEGQAFGQVSQRAPANEGPAPEASAESSSAASGAVEGLGLPSDPGAIVRYLTHRYKGVGEKTAEALVERFGSDLFATLQNDPAAIQRAVPAKRAEQVLEAWRADYERRSSGASGESNGPGDRAGNGRGGRGRGRGRGRG